MAIIEVASADDPVLGSVRSVTLNGGVDVVVSLVSATVLFTALVTVGVVVFAVIGVAGLVSAVGAVVSGAAAVDVGESVAVVVVTGVVVAGGVVSVDGAQLGSVNTPPVELRWRTIGSDAHAITIDQ